MGWNVIHMASGWLSKTNLSWNAQISPGLVKGIFVASHEILLINQWDS